MRQRTINWAGAMRDMRRHRSPENRLIREMLDACKAVVRAHEELFSQCASNPLSNAWGKEVSVSALNEAARLAQSAIAKAKEAGHV